MAKSTQSSQAQSSHSHSLSLNQSPSAHTGNDTNCTNASFEPSESNHSMHNCENYNSDADSTYSQSPSSKSKSNSISFSYKKSQIGQFYMKQEAAKKSKNYKVIPKINLPVQIPMNNAENKDNDDDGIIDRIHMNCMYYIFTKY